jgi:hypothetical protein
MTYSEYQKIWLKVHRVTNGFTFKTQITRAFYGYESGSYATAYVVKQHWCPLNVTLPTRARASEILVRGIDGLYWSVPCFALRLVK